jgi:hypothetical protein
MTDLPTDETEFTELVDADVPRVDLVGSAANGVPGFLVMKQDAHGLLDPAFVRELVAKAEPDPPSDEQVTMTGSPAAIAKFIHQAAQRAAPVEKAEMSTADIDDLPDDAFAYVEPGGEKDDEGKTTPRSLRHFPINDEAHVRNALARAPQSPFGDKAMPKIRAEAKKLGIEVAKEMDMADADVLDPTTALAESDADAPGSPTDPGSPAWEAIDAATARKWTSILARAKHAVGMLADREMLEAAVGDGDDAMQAMDLDDACCAIDYAISVLAPFAVAEQAEADCGAEMQAVGKALAEWSPEPLDTIEALGQVRKAGRVLSTANEAAIRGAVESLQKVLASLPAAPTAPEDGQSVAKEQETDMTTTPETPAAEVAKADGEKPTIMVVYDQKGRLVGVVDPDKVTPVANSEAEPEPDGDEPAGDAAEAAPDATPETTDLTPAPAAEVGTPADGVPDDEAVAKQTETTNETASEDVLKSIATDVAKTVLDAYSASQREEFAKQATALVELVDVVETLKGQVKALEEQPAVPKVFTQGAVPPRDMLRGQDRGAAPVDMAKAQEMKKGLYSADAPEQNRIATDMQTAAIARLQEIHQRRA